MNDINKLGPVLSSDLKLITYNKEITKLMTMSWLPLLACVVTMVMPPLQPSQKLSTQQEAERQAIHSLRGGGALTGKFLSTSSLPAGMSYHK